MDTQLEFSAADLAQTRFAVSPMWQVATSFRALAAAPGAVHPVLRPWAQQVRPRAAAAGLDRGWLAALIPAVNYLPDFLNPAPTEPFPDLAVELAAIRATPADRVRHELAMFAELSDGDLGRGRLRTLREAPEAALAQIADELAAYWDLALAPYWARIRSVLEADMFHRARQVAEHGAGHLFSDLHATVRWGDDVLRLVHRQCAMSRGTAGAGLILVPSAFCLTSILTWMAPPDPPQLCYPARGAGTVWERREFPHTDAVAAVIGRSRTLLLAELEAPASTTELAARTGMSPSGVSQHLSALRGAGMVSAHRAGHSVLYARTAVAESLLANAA
jgi:DNA-binding transcriptional ArsR family regulator